MEDVLETEVAGGKTVADFIAPEFLFSVAGSVVAAIAILVIGWICPLGCSAAYAH